MSPLRGGSKAPVAVAGILAVPLFFVALMAFSLKFDKPSHHLTKKGVAALGDPTKGTVGTIYLLAFAVSAAVVLVGVLTMPLRSRLATIVPAVAAIVASILLVLPLATWAAEHTKRYPLGADNIAQRNPEDQFLRGEWEQTARATAHQVGLVTIVLALVAIALSVLLEIRHRRGIEGPAVPPPPETAGVPGTGAV
jgi:4-amino-4-deoxy-L-arabinose transferase-like glycosyltransferase